MSAVSTQARQSTPPLTPQELDELLTIDELAAMLHVRRSTVYHWCTTGKIPYFRLGRRSLFHPRHVAEYVSARFIEPVGGAS